MSLWKLLNGRWGSGAGETDEIRIDGSTNTLQIIDYAHHEIHSGNAYTAHFDITTGATDNHRTAIGFSVPNTTKWIHLIIAGYASASAEIFIEESPTIDDDAGTQATIYNRNRNSGNTSGILSLEGTPVANEVTTFTEAQIAGANYSAGTILDHKFIASGSKQSAIGGDFRGTQEWILDQAGKYLIMIQNRSATATDHEIHLEWYEHTDKH